MKQNQKGFSAVEALLVLVILALIGGVGYYVYKSRQEANKSQDNANKSSLEISQAAKKEAEKKPADETEGWLLYKPPTNEYEIRLPDGWKLERTEKAPHLAAAGMSSIVYKAGTKAVVTEVEGGRDYGSLAFSLAVYKASEGSAPRGSEVKKFNTSQGLVITQWLFEQTAEPEGIDIPKGAKEYRYELTAKDKKISFTHDVLPGETAQTDLIEKAIKTLQVK